MRRTIGVVFVVLCLGLPALATAQATGGVKGGLALSKATDEEPAVARWLTAWSVGGFVAVPMAGNVFFQPEVLYTRKGIKLDEDGTTMKFHVDYVEIPLLVRYASSGPRQAGFDVFGGIAPAVRTRARAIMGDESQDIGDILKSWDAGVVVGAGVHGGGVSGEVRWTEGLVKLPKADSADAKTRNRTISILVGYQF